jgi:hypothetical protein
VTAAAGRGDLAAEVLAERLLLAIYAYEHRYPRHRRQRRARAQRG